MSEGTDGTLEGTFTSEDQCSEGAFGPLCDLCYEGYSLVYTGQCEPCGGAQVGKMISSGGRYVASGYLCT